MADVQARPIHGIGGVVPGASEAEKIAADQRKLVADQLEAANKIREQQAAQLRQQQEFQRQQALQQEQARLAAQQAKQNPNPSFMGQVATTAVKVGAAAVIAGEVIKQNPELMKDAQEKLAELLGAPTPATTALLGIPKAKGPNTPASNAKTLELEIDETSKIRTVLDQYALHNEQTRALIENDVREVNSAFRTIQDGTAATTAQQIDDTNNVLIDFHRTVESTSLRALTQEQEITKSVALAGLGTSTKDLERAKELEAQLQEQAKAQAKAIADEVTAQVVRDNRQQSEYLQKLDRDHRQKEDERQAILNKERASVEATQQRQAQGIEGQVQTTGQNVDPKTLRAIEQQRAAQGLQTDPSKVQQAPAFDKEGNYVIPSQKDLIDQEIDQKSGKFELDYHEVRAFTDEGTADYQGNWTQKDVGHAMTSSLGHSRDAKPIPGDDKSAPIVPQGIDSIDRGDGQMEAWGRDVPIRRFGPENDPV